MINTNREVYHTSIIVPVYNDERYLRECIESILAQTIGGYELILVDDGSTDNSPKIMQEYAHKYENVFVYRQENKKLGAARNTGLQRARGKYILFVDSDDCIQRNCLEILYNKAEDNNLDVLLYDASTFKEEGFELEEYWDKRYDRSNLNIPEETVFSGYAFFETYMPRAGVCVNAYLHYVNTSFLVSNDIFFREGVFHEDVAYALQIYKSAQRLMYCSKKMYMRRYRPNSIIFSKYTEAHINGALIAVSDSLRYIMDMQKENGKSKGAQIFLRNNLQELNRYLSQYPIEEITNRKWIKEFWYVLTSIDMKWICENMNGIVRYMLLNLYKTGSMEKAWNLSDDIYAEVKKRYQLLVDKIENTFLEHFSRDGLIAIYGIGKNTDSLIKYFIEVCPNLREKIVFVTTDEPQETHYRGIAPIVSIHSMSQMNVTGILISSTNYEQEMIATIKELYGNGYPYRTFRELMNE